MLESFVNELKECFGSTGEVIVSSHSEVTLEVPAKSIKNVCLHLVKQPKFEFNQLMDLCGVDYLQYGVSEWATESTTVTGFSRGVEGGCSSAEGRLKAAVGGRKKERFAVVYHLLSLVHNRRIRVRAFLPVALPEIDSVVDIWPAANWFEREAFDLYGILFQGHPDLRRILTDYGFKGHPFRKDFPLIGQVEMRYDAKAQRCVYEPVSIQPRTLVPKVIRKDARYERS